VIIGEAGALRKTTSVFFWARSLISRGLLSRTITRLALKAFIAFIIDCYSSGLLVGLKESIKIPLANIVGNIGAIDESDS
jgi:hypothetical protein